MTLRSRLALALVTMAAILVAPLFIAYDSLNSMRSALRGVQEQDLNATLLEGPVGEAAEAGLLRLFGLAVARAAATGRNVPSRALP